MNASPHKINIFVYIAVFIFATVLFVAVISIQPIKSLLPIANAESDGVGGSGGDGVGGSGSDGVGGSGSDGVGGSGSDGIGGSGSDGIGGSGDDSGAPSPDTGGPGITSAAPPSTPATPPSMPPSTPPAATPPAGPPGGGGPFLGVCLDRQATNYGGTLPCLYPAGSPITLARRITPLSYVYLSQVPYTGIGGNAASYAFLITLLGISGFLSYQYMYGKKENFLALAGISGLKDAFTFPTKTAPVEAPQKMEVPTAPQNPHYAALFIKALLERDQDVAFMLLRGVLREEASVRNFIVKAIAEIETAYRIKIGEAGALHPTTAEAVALHTPETLEILLTHLLSAIHTPFTSHALAAQIAVVKITEALQTLPLTQEV